MTKTVFLVAGGTGGHVFPALALAEELLARGYQVECLTDKRGEKFFRQTNLVPHVVDSSAWGGDWRAKLKAGLKILHGMIQSFEIAREYSPDVVVGFGGYPSFPTVKAAQLLKIPTILHEQNAVFGRANRQVSKVAVKIATSFADTKLMEPYYKTRTVVTGNPVRRILAEAAMDYAAPSDEGKINLLIFAGSQGSALFSKILPEAMSKLDPELKKRLSITQQCRFEDVEKVSAIYQEMGIKAKIQPFFADMLKLYQKTHLIIARAGASSVAEITSLGCPAIFIPLAASLDGDQAQNAQQIVAHKAGWMMMEKELTAEAMAQKLTDILKDPAQLQNAAAAAKQLGNPQAAAKLADVIEKII